MSQALSSLLDPVNVQKEAMKRLFQRRRGIPDVDPETGEPLADDADTSAPGTGDTGATPNADA